MQVLIQRAVSQQAMANMMQAAGMPAPDMPGGGRSGPQVIGPSVGLAAALKSIENLMTNRYRDHEAPEDQNCELFPYRERKTKCPNGNAHHVVPDHCWRMGSGIQKLLPAMRASAELDDALPHSEGACYHKNMQKADGLSICVDGKGKTGTHGKIHDVFDPAELALGQKGNPPYTSQAGRLGGRRCPCGGPGHRLPRRKPAPAAEGLPRRQGLERKHLAAGRPLRQEHHQPHGLHGRSCDSVWNHRCVQVTRTSREND